MNREQLRERRRQIATEVERGIRLVKVAESFAVTQATVWNACKEFGISPPSADERRIKMASDVEQGQSVKAVADKYGYSAQTVQKACEEFNVKTWLGLATVSGDTMNTIREVLPVIAELFQENRIGRIAASLGIPVADIKQVKKLCIEAGISIAGRKKTRT
jgi:transposase